MKSIIYATFVTSIIIIIFSCKKDKAADQSLYSEISSGSYEYYKSGNILSAASASPHGSFKLKINALAKSTLDSNWKVINGKTFPEGSLIIKEVYDKNSLALYAVMKKESNNKDAKNGWVWAELKPDGSFSYSTGKMGSGCVGCHNQSPSHDYVRTFDLH